MNQKIRKRGERDEARGSVEGRCVGGEGGGFISKFSVAKVDKSDITVNNIHF